MKKYELTDNYIIHNDKKLYQIKAISSFGEVSAGDLGGYIEKEENLSQDGNAWVYEKAKIYDNACVYENARVSGNVEVYNNARIYGNADIYQTRGRTIYIHDNACVYENASVGNHSIQIFGNANIYGKASIGPCTKIYDNALIFGESEVNSGASARLSINGNARIFGQSVILANSEYFEEEMTISGDVTIYGNPEIIDSTIVGSGQIFGNCRIFNTEVKGNPNIYGNCCIYDSFIDDDVRIYEECQITNSFINEGANIYGSTIIESALIDGNARICNESIIKCGHISGRAWINKTYDYLCVGPLKPDNLFMTFFKQDNDEIGVAFGSHNLSLEEYEKELNESDSGIEYKKMYLSMVDLAKMHFKK